MERPIYVGLKSSQRIAVALSLAACCGGCIIPVPHQRVHVYGVSGQIVSAADQTPISDASVSSPDVPEVTAQSDTLGAFRLRPVRGWHGAYCVGPICLSLLPGWDVTYPGRKIQVSAPGYRTASFTIEAWVPPDGSKIAAEIAGAYLHTGQLQLVREVAECSNACQTVQRTGASRSAQETNPTSSAAGSRR